MDHIVTVFRADNGERICPITVRNATAEEAVEIGCGIIAAMARLQPNDVTGTATPVS